MLKKVFFLTLRISSVFYGSPALYTASREDLFDVLRRVDLMARVKHTRRKLSDREYIDLVDLYGSADREQIIDEYALSLSLKDDPSLDEEDLQQLADEAEALFRTEG